MKKSIQYICILFGLFLSSMVFAQEPENLKREVEVIKEYQPRVSDAQKIIDMPQIGDSLQATPSFDYKIKSTPINVEKSVNSLPIINYSNSEKTKSGLGYLKGGFGNGWANYGEFVLNSSPSEKSNFGMHLYHWSENPKAKLMNEMRLKTPFSNQNFALFGANEIKKNSLKWKIDFDRLTYNYYGLQSSDTVLYNQILTSEEISKQHINKFGADVVIKNQNARSKLDYSIQLKNQYLWLLSGQKNNYSEVVGNFIQSQRDYQIKLDSKLAYNYQDQITNVATGFENSSHAMFNIGLSPSIYFEGANWNLKAGLNLGGIIDPDTTFNFHWSPNVRFTYQPIKSILSLFVGANGGFQTNQLSKSIYENQYQLATNDLLPTEKIYAFFGGFKGKITNQLSYLIDVDYSAYNNFIQYYSTYTSYNLTGIVYAYQMSELENKFSASQIDLTSLRFGANLLYSQEGLSVQAKANFYNHQSTSTDSLSHMPTYNFSLKAATTITNKVSAWLNLQLRSKIYGKEELTVKTINFDSAVPTYLTTMRRNMVEIPTKIDIDLGADYTYSNNLMFYLTINNLFNQNHQDWLGYTDPGMIVMIGARFNF